MLQLTKVVGENAQEARIANAIYSHYTMVIDYLKTWFANRMMRYTNVYVLDTSIVDLIEVHYLHTNR